MFITRPGITPVFRPGMSGIGGKLPGGGGGAVCSSNGRGSYGRVPVAWEGALCAVGCIACTGLVQWAAACGEGVVRGHPVSGVGGGICSPAGNTAWISCSVGWFAVISGGVQDVCMV